MSFLSEITRHGSGIMAGRCPGCGRTVLRTRDRIVEDWDPWPVRTRVEIAEAQVMRRTPGRLVVHPGVGCSILTQVPPFEWRVGETYLLRHVCRAPRIGGADTSMPEDAAPAQDLSFLPGARRAPGDPWAAVEPPLTLFDQDQDKDEEEQ